MAIVQLSLPLDQTTQTTADEIRRERLAELLSGDLDFHSQDSQYASHNFHSFPAKFPPQLPRKFIKALTEPEDVVLDPMVGSGTTILEAFLLDRRGIGFDIDPLALLISKVKVTPLDVLEVSLVGHALLQRAAYALQERSDELAQTLERRFDARTRQFISQWFAGTTQLELLSLVREIEKIDAARLRAFFELAFSAIIITKTGGVSLALDLGHTRPHQAKVVITRSGKVMLGKDLADHSSTRIKVHTKTLRPALEEFERRFEQNLKGLLESGTGITQPMIACGNAQRLPLNDASVDLIVTSPPYASNAIDYMRAHKFSLAWLGYTIEDLSQKRNEYIGGEVVREADLEALPDFTAGVVEDVARKDQRKGRVLHRYYSEMTRTLREMFRVLKPGKVAIVVVGSSIMRGRDTETQHCLADIGRSLGFDVPGIGVRNLDRDRRMLPAGSQVNLSSQIQQRMHAEYVIGFYKPQSTT